ncbi:MAG: HAMP domain-containing sensor histidine kinase, partial [Oscillospiraceae bacterium]|nr:HAMP domain-containing sensor histidine kinase [Oscillospiraceae bacterium]
EIDKMKNDFISTVSHEIRTPLTAIKGWGETLMKVGSDRQILDKGLGIIVNETARLSSMVEELLDFSRMQGGDIKIIVCEVDLSALTEDIYTFYKSKAEDEQISLTFTKYDDEKLTILCDRDKIRQVLINVIDNAIKYTNPGGKIEISVARIQKYVKISISDTGCGIPQKDLPHVKEKFYKANNTVRGTGIGLAVADEIVRMHRGELNLSSEVGQGTTVEIILPVNFKEV